MAGIGIVTNSTIAIVGAMVVGPEFGPLAALSLALVVGFVAAMAVTAVAAAASIPLGLVPRDLLVHGESAVDFIYIPDRTR